MTVSFFEGAIPCELKEYHGQKYITLDGLNIRAYDCCRPCAEHRKCKKLLNWKIIKGWYNDGSDGLRSECPYHLFGGITPISLVEIERKQSSLDRWMQ